jgi:hypothetical protein
MLHRRSEALVTEFLGHALALGALASPNSRRGPERQDCSAKASVQLMGARDIASEDGTFMIRRGVQGAAFGATNEGVPPWEGGSRGVSFWGHQ